MFCEGCEQQIMCSQCCESSADRFDGSHLCNYCIADFLEGDVAVESESEGEGEDDAGGASAAERKRDKLMALFESDSDSDSDEGGFQAN